MGDTVGGEEGDFDGEADTGYSHPLLLACGANIFSELGLGVCETGRCLPVPVPLPKTREAHIRIVASGSHHSFCVLSDGVVLGWGRNHDGQLGKGDTEQVISLSSLPQHPIKPQLADSYPYPLPCAFPALTTTPARYHCLLVLPRSPPFPLVLPFFLSWSVLQCVHRCLSQRSCGMGVTAWAQLEAYRAGSHTRSFSSRKRDKAEKT